MVLKFTEEEKQFIEQWDAKSGDREALTDLAITAFHRLWGQAKGHDDYDKSMWRLLQLCLNKLGAKV